LCSQERWRDREQVPYKLTMTMIMSEKTGDILDRYPAVRGRPEEMAMLCSLLRERGLLEDALAVGEGAVAAAPDSLAVDMAVRGALAQGVQSFHRTMLLDGNRNRAYARAIEAAVRPGMTVLEIGCGAGLLAMIAARAGARVVTCEAKPMIAAAATEIIRRNGLSERIRVVAKSSTDLSIPGDLAEPADLVIHEIFGPQLFDEGVTHSLSDARARLLKPGARSVPGRACVRLALVRDNRERDRRTLGDVEGFDLSAFDLLQEPERWIRRGQMHKVEMCSEPVSALSMDYDRSPPFGPASETVSLTSTGGRIDAVMQWISIQFGPDEIYENAPSPHDDGSSWGVSFRRLPSPIETAAGERVDVTLRHRGMLLTLDVARLHVG
jgi:type II protein arginine methyltransferase|tara:strand:+ start:38099 stop:39241 length:1143 start_codon:yes stop_codon:yes gene_type:complete